MPNSSLFECGNTKCAYAIDTADLNKVQLEALRRWAKTCPRCGQRTKWLEKLPLLNTKTLKSKADGGSTYENLTIQTNSSLPKSASQRRRASRHDRQH